MQKILDKLKWAPFKSMEHFLSWTIKMMYALNIKWAKKTFEWLINKSAWQNGLQNKIKMKYSLAMI